MSTFSSANIIQKNIITKPYLLTTDELNQIGLGINLVGYDFLKSLPTPIDETIVNFKYGNPSSPRLLNWVEPYEIAGVNYTLFYSEVNSGLKIGDKVFIINGAYDSNLLIKQDKYKKGTDGYEVLFIDKCKIVLDIEFVGWLPANETSDNQELFDDFIKVYFIKDKNDFIHVNRQISTRDNQFKLKFNPHQNNIIFSNSDFDSITGWGETIGLTGSPGFFIKNYDNTWENITNDFIIGSYSMVATNSNDKIIILNSSFTVGDYEFKEDSVYTWDSTLLSWIINVKHENNNPPIITKSNFRDGQFDGQWNGGVYGTNEKRIIWNSQTSTWNSGTLLNTIWQSGIMNSFYTQLDSYFAEFDYSLITTSTPYGLPYQKINNVDNNGYGYNFVINSDIQNAVINNGNVTNSKLGASASSYNIVEEYIKNTLNLNNFDTASGLTVNKALFDNCKFINANIENTEIRNCRAINSRFNKVKSVNSHYKSSLFFNSNYISDNIIKVIDYDEFTYSDDNLDETHKVYKFYINKRSYEKFKLKDTFYIKGIKINNNSGELLNFFDNKFKIGPWKEYVDFDIQDGNGFTKLSIEYNAFISTPKENEYRYSVDIANTLNVNTLFDEKGRDYYSVDIFINRVYDQANTFEYTKDFNNTFLETGILDFSEAYIINSDFESGIFENSNWNSGNYINYSNDNNITKDILNGGGLYNITLSGTNSLIFTNTVSNSGIASEVEFDYFDINNIIFLNSVDYDTRGKVTDFIILEPGSGYNSELVTTYNGSGTGLVINLDTSVIGSVTGITFSIDSNNYFEVINGFDIRQTDGGSGTGLEVLITIDNTLYFITSVTIYNPGSGYQVGDILEILHIGIDESILTTEIIITDILNGEVLNSSIISESGIGYKIGDLLTINNGNYDAVIEVTGITGSLIRLPDSYKIKNRNISGTLQELELESILTFPNLLDGGIFFTNDANNKYGYLHKTKFNRSRIITGIFKRAYITGSLLKDDNFDISDKDFNNIKKIKNLIFTDTIFSNNSNILSKATYMNSFITGGSDIWENGILYDSIWNGNNFRNGLVKESIWIDGTFSDGLFYNSRSFDNGTFSNYNQNIKTRYYKSGTIENARFSWQNGTFIDGEFYKSDWENGTFNNGKFYYSKFYDGIFNNGIIGDKSIPMDTTWLYNGVVNYAVVENSKLVSEKYNGITSSTIIWNDGIFNSGVFGTNDNQNVNNKSTWNYGMFNGGEFKNIAKWKNGIFNGGKFLSNYNFTDGISIGPDSGSQFKEEYSWEYGVFNGGEFGNANTATNSTWFDGEFNGGQFKGRLWNNGIFSFGEFLGSGILAIGGTASELENSNPNKFVKSYNESPKRYYGLWRNGYVTDIKDKYLTDKKLFTNVKRSSDTTKFFNRASLKNVLWENGVFSHQNGEINNSVWMDGTFEGGRFISSSFNPYIRRPSNNEISFNFSDTCYWKNGLFEGGEFNISNWDNGTFLSGTATGMIWKNGIANYMNAYNVFWENGLWRNGNWNGSYFNLSPTGSVIDNYSLQVLHNGMSFSATSSVHVWNIFYNESLTDTDTSSTVGWGGFISDSDGSPTMPTTFNDVYDIISIFWSDIDNSNDRTGSDNNITVILVSELTFGAFTWEYSVDNINWISISTLNSITNSYTLSTGENYLRLKKIYIDEGSVNITYSNILRYTKD